MAWPGTKPDNTAFDADSDKISSARAELLVMSQAVNDMVDFLNPNDVGEGKILKYNSTSGALEFETLGVETSAESNGVFYGATTEIIATAGNITPDEPALGQTVVVQHIGDPNTGYNYDIDLKNYVGNQKVVVVHDGQSVDINSVNTRVLYNGVLITSMTSTPLGTSTVGEFTIIDTDTEDSAGKDTYVKYHTAKQNGAVASGTEKVT